MHINKKNLNRALNAEDGKLLAVLINSQKRNLIDKFYNLNHQLPSVLFFKKLKKEFPDYVIPVLIKICKFPDTLKQSIPNYENDIIWEFNYIIRWFFSFDRISDYGSGQQIFELLDAIFHKAFNDDQTFIKMLSPIKDKLETLKMLYISLEPKITNGMATPVQIYFDRIFDKIVSDITIFKAVVTGSKDLSAFTDLYKSFSKPTKDNLTFQKDYVFLAEKKYCHIRTEYLKLWDMNQKTHQKLKEENISELKK